MSSERAGTPTHGALDREEAREALLRFFPGHFDLNRVLDALEACVVPDPRSTRIEALLKQYEEHPPDSDWYDGNVPGQELRAILRGDR